MQAFAQFVGFPAGIGGDEQVTIEVTQPYSEGLTQGRSRDGADHTHRTDSRTTGPPLRLATRFGRPASGEQALSALYGVQYAANFFPARIACLEVSVAAMLTLALAGYRACWCHGVAADPLRLHAWIEAGGKRVGEPASTELFIPIMRIPSRRDDATRRPM